jgi:hypothetical protein
MYHDFECEICKKKCRAYRGPAKSKPRACSKVCYLKLSPKWLQKIPFNKLSDEEKKQHLAKHFEKRVIRKKGCWDWSAKGKGSKYMRMDYARGEPRISAHRYSYMIHKGEIPRGMFVCHSCDNPRCTNPDHLFLGTDKDNQSDKIKKNRQCHGESHRNSKIKTSDVIKIKKLLSVGISGARISRDLNISIHIIYHIKHGSWKHVKF